jgi:hypothetical protein
MDPASGYLTKRDKKLPSDLLHFTAVFIHHKPPPPPWTRPKSNGSSPDVANVSSRGGDGANTSSVSNEGEGELTLYPLEDWDCKV